MVDVRLLAIALAAIAGFVDAVGYLSLGGQFVAHMTGDTSRLGQHLGLAQLEAALPPAVAVVAFVVSVALGTLLVGGGRSGLCRALALEAALLAPAAIYGGTLCRHGVVPRSDAGYWVVLPAVVAAMGVQSAIALSWRSETLRTTFLTGMLTRLGRTVAELATSGPGGERRRDGPQALLIVAVWAAFVGAGAGGALLLGRWQLWSLSVPLAAVVLLAGACAHGVDV